MDVSKEASPGELIRFSTWNIDTLMSKSLEVANTIIRRRINIMCLQETE